MQNMSMESVQASNASNPLQDDDEVEIWVRMTPKNRRVQADELRWTMSTLPRSYAKREIRRINRHLATDYPYLFFYLQVPNAPEIHLPPPDPDDELEQHYDQAPASADEEEEPMFLTDEQVEQVLGISLKSEDEDEEQATAEEGPEHEYLDPGPGEIIFQRFNCFAHENGIFITERAFATNELFPLDAESQKRYDALGPIDEHPF